MLRVGIPKGSLEEQTLRLLNAAGYSVSFSHRSYICSLYNHGIEFHLCKPFEIAQLVYSNVLHAGICGYDSLVELDLTSRVTEVCKLNYSKRTSNSSLYVIAVPENSSIRTLNDLNGKTIATERVNILTKFLEAKKIKATVIKSLGATEIKPSYNMCDAICDITETGESLVANKLRVVSKVLETNTLLVKSSCSMQDTKVLDDIGVFAFALSCVTEKLMVLLFGNITADLEGLKLIGYRVIDFNSSKIIICSKNDIPILYKLMPRSQQFLVTGVSNLNYANTLAEEGAN